MLGETIITFDLFVKAYTNQMEQVVDAPMPLIMP